MLRIDQILQLRMHLITLKPFRHEIDGHDCSINLSEGSNLTRNAILNSSESGARTCPSALALCVEMLGLIL